MDGRATARQARRIALLKAVGCSLNAAIRGEVQERFNWHAWRACAGETLPRVRIPASPPRDPAWRDRSSWLIVHSSVMEVDLKSTLFIYELRPRWSMNYEL